MESSLPTELTRFIGRGRELDELRGLLGSGRLLTLTGAAGSGKTRLALELVAGRAPDAPPAWWVELASLREEGLVVPAVAERIGLGDEVRPGDSAGLARRLAGHAGLLVLDNCEHLVDSCAVLVDRLLSDCTGLSVLATSREALGVRGERAWLVPPLDLPGTPTFDAAASSSAVRLFVERARDVVPSFALTQENVDAVVEICRRLDGIPLAIELAAARVKALSPADIRDRLDDVFHLLPSAGRTAPPRHRTLRAAIDWSHDLLTEEARVLFRRLAVFRGGFGLDGAERVGAGGAIATGAVLDGVARLVDRSLLDVREHHGATRYSYLEAVRQYATGQLIESGEEAEVRQRHARFVLERVEEAEPHLTRVDRRLWVDRLNDDLDNIRSALGWSRDHDPALHVRLVGKLWWFWFSSRHWIEAGRWIDGALALPEAGTAGPGRAALRFAAGALAALRARLDEARPALEEAVALAGETGDDRLRAYALNYLGLSYAGEGRPEAPDLCRQAERWFREHGDLYGLRLALLLQGSSAMARGDLEEAESLNQEGVAVARRFGQGRELAVSLQNLAAVYLTAGRAEEAGACIREAMAASRQDPSLYFISTGIAYAAEVEAASGRPVEAARLLGAAEAVRERIDAAPFPVDARRQAAVVERVRVELGLERFGIEWGRGRALEPEALLDDLAAGLRAPGAAGAAEPPTASTPRSVSVEVAAASAEPGPRLRVRALGPLEVEVDGKVLAPEAWPYAKPAELLLFLLLDPRGASRDRIGEALWPGVARTNLKNSFHVTLHHLRKALGHPEWVVLEGDRYRLAPGLRCAFDLDAFEGEARRLLRSGVASQDELRAVLSLYRGELLEGNPAGRWIDEHRDRARSRFVALTLALGAALEPERPDEALDLYRRLAAAEELDEEVHRRLMTVLAKSGDRAAALRHYDRVARLLRDHLDAEPEAETVALHERIRAGSGGSVAG